jgi:non-heme chloroperoxidase
VIFKTWLPLFFDTNSALLAVKLLKKGELKVYSGFPHGIATTHADIINKDPLTFFRT